MGHYVGQNDDSDPLILLTAWGFLSKSSHSLLLHDSLHLDEIMLPLLRKTEGEREKGKIAGKGHGLESNLSRLLSARRHMVMCSSQ